MDIKGLLVILFFVLLITGEVENMKPKKHKYKYKNRKRFLENFEEPLQKRDMNEESYELFNQ
uniref:Venom protein 22.1 n=2 Tax=Lychas mucronatus TaxID=172552 RepID=NDBR_LYCMC|nr:RecName: Full=Venom protein 22.1; Flags: Precursor [Lychas mucronatus]ABY26701.1 NDBP9 [Lychas mucronatus]